MPHGNVGTSTELFLDFIRTCKLPATVIGKLGLKFPKSLGKRKYSSVPFEYCARGARSSNSAAADGVSDAGGPSVEVDDISLAHESLEDNNVNNNVQEPKIDSQKPEDSDGVIYYLCYITCMIPFIVCEILN